MKVVFPEPKNPDTTITGNLFFTNTSSPDYIQYFHQYLN